MDTKYQEQFRDAIGGAGITPPRHVTADGKIHRFASNGKPADDSGWYVLHDGNVPAGAFGCWREGFQSTWCADIGRKLTVQEGADQRAQVEAMRIDAAAEREQAHENGRRNAEAAWRDGTPAGDDHPYLARKGVNAHGLRVLPDNKLLVPMRDADGVLHSMQKIAPDGEKRFQKGGRVAGCFYMIGEPVTELCIAEGFATAASVFEATGSATACAFNAGNLRPVAEALRAKYPDTSITVCADDDPSGTGLWKATEAARAVGGMVALPDFGSDRPEGATDFNDLVSIKSQDAALNCIANAKPPQDAIAAPVERAAMPELPAPTPSACDAAGVDLQGDDLFRRVQSALACIKHVNGMAMPAAKIVGFGLAQEFRRERPAVGAALAAEWDAANPDSTIRAVGIYGRCNLDHPHPVTLGSVWRLAKEAGWQESAQPAVADDARKFFFVHASELLKPTRVRWLIDHFIETNTGGLLFGASTAGKSFLALDWACCVATGTPWHGHHVESGSVFIIAGEGHAGIGRRLRAWEVHNGIALASAPLFVSQIPAALISQSSANAVRAAVQALIEAHGRPALIVVDTLARNLGAGDESSAEDIGAYVANLDGLRVGLSCAVLTVHHSGHGATDRARGSSALKAAVDYEFRLELTGGQRLLTCTKAKDAEPPPPLAMTLKTITLDGWKLDGEDAPTSCVLLPEGSPGGAIRIERPKELTGATRVALEQLQKALDVHGVPPTDAICAELVGDLVRPLRVVTEGQWRERCYLAGIADGDQSAQQKAFARARKTLLDSGRIATWHGHVWQPILH